MTAAPSGLRVEHLDEALGIRTAAPRLSWRLPDGAREQRAYRITSDSGWDSGWVDSDQNLLIPYAGPPLESSQRVTWRVSVRTDLGESPESEACWFETGLLWAEDWQASWVEPGKMPDGAPGERPAALLRFDFAVDRPVVSARLHATAQGLYEAFLNAVRVGDAELTPGFTQYDERLQVQTYDVGDAVREGCNALAVVLADGWFRGQTGITRSADQWGNRLALLAQLHLVHDDGSVTLVGTGPGWHSSTGHVVAADLIAGERWELTLRQRGWDSPGFDDSAWDDVTEVEHGFAGLVDSPAPPVRRVAEIVPVSVRRLDDSRQIVDLGQNINGWVRLSDLGPAGTTITLTHGEWLGPDGDVTTDHLRPAVPFLPEPLPAGQVDQVVSSGLPGEAFEPRRTTHGFQYVRVEGHPDDLTVDDVRGIVVHTDMRRTGWFSSSEQRLDRFHEAAVWSFRGNACDVPTDCPHRERGPWTGDWQLYVPTAAFLYDVAGLSTKWLRDVAVDQWPDGTVANMSPSTRGEGRESPVAFLNGSAGWGDAAVIVPWELYRAYGDVQVLDELWPTMVAWLDRVERMARSQRHPDRAARTPEPEAHERFLWDTGFHWGEWLVPGEEIANFPALVAADKGDVATAFYAYSSRLMGRIAEVLGRADDAARYADLSEQVRDAWRTEYLDADGRLTPDTQANHVRALAFDLVPDELRPAVAERLVELIRKADTHLGTGFLATPYLLPVLADTGHLDVAYELLLQDSEPSWLVMVDRGATTVWERWNGVSTDGVPHESLNHYSKGAVISFLHRYTAGIELVGPAYRRFRVRPRPGGGLTSAAAAHESPCGRIESAWHLDGNTFHLHVVVPAGTEAEVVLPDGCTATAPPGQHTYTSTTEEQVMTPETTEWAGPARYLPPPPPTRRDDGALHYSGVTYAAPGGYRPLQLDVWVPESVTAPPLVVWIHGGAWMMGDRRYLPETLRPNQVFDDLLAAGLAVATIDYRHALEAPFPAQLHDAKAAVRYLRSHADVLGVDTNRIGVMGESAGGHLAALVGLTAHRPDLEGGLGVVGPSSAVDVVVDWYGVADMSTMPRMEPPPEIAAKLEPVMRVPAEDNLLRGLDDATRADASPITHVTPEAPPFLLVHGTTDWLVPYAQSEQLQAALTAAGVPVRLVPVEGAEHIFTGCDDIDAVVQLSVDYLAMTLNGDAR